MRVTRGDGQAWLWPNARAVAPLVLPLFVSGCFEGGDYQQGGRRIEAPGWADAADDPRDDATALEDASMEGASEVEDGATSDGLLDVPRAETPSNVDDAGDGQIEGGPSDVRTDGPPSGSDASEPRDGGVDIVVRDVPVEPRRD